LVYGNQSSLGNSKFTGSRCGASFRSALTALDAPSVKQTVVLKQSGSTLMTLETKPGGFSTMTLATGSERKLDPQTWAESLTKQFDAIKGAQEIQATRRATGD